MCLQEDVTYIDDTIRDLDARWKELTGLSSGRKKDLDENYKLSHKFFKGTEELLNMLDEAERSLKDEEPIGVDPAHLRSQLKKHKVCECLFFHFFVSFVLKEQHYLILGHFSRRREFRSTE